MVHSFPSGSTPLALPWKSALHAKSSCVCCRNVFRAHLGRLLHLPLTCEPVRPTIRHGPSMRNKVSANLWLSDIMHVTLCGCRTGDLDIQVNRLQRILLLTHHLQVSVAFVRVGDSQTGPDTPPQAPGVTRAHSSST